MIKSSLIFVKLPDITGLYVVEQVQEHQSLVSPGLMLQAGLGSHARFFKNAMIAIPHGLHEKSVFISHGRGKGKNISNPHVA